MAKNKDGAFKTLFLIAAIYDFLLGAIFLFFYKPIYSMFNIALPAYPMYLQMSAAFVFAMGFGYYFIYKNLTIAEKHNNKAKNNTQLFFINQKVKAHIKTLLNHILMCSH